MPDALGAPCLSRDVKRRAMKAIFVTSLVCSFASLIGLLGFWIMDIVPSPGSEAWRLKMMLVATAFLLGWLGLGMWARGQSHRPAGPTALPSWLRGIVVVAGALYVLVVLLFTVG